MTGIFEEMAGRQVWLQQERKGEKKKKASKGVARKAAQIPEAYEDKGKS